MGTHWLSVADILAGTGLTRGSIYRQASLGRWRRLRWQGRVYYHADDVFGRASLTSL